jgi:hypothetical protein
MDDLPVGAQFTYKDKRYAVVRQGGCDGCAFQSNKTAACNFVPKCGHTADNPSRIFVRLEQAVAMKLLGEL